MPSSAQVVPVVVLFDYLLNSAGVAMANETITVVLNYRGATSITPLTTISSGQVSVQTDTNGYWQFSLVPNTNINPANTLYTVLTPLSSYDVTLGATGPYQSTAAGTLVNSPSSLIPSTSSVGPLTVTGALTVTGDASAATMHDTGLTAGQVVFPAAGGLLSGATGLTWDTTANALTATNVYHKGIPVFDVRAYGAKGDGVTDDTAAIQAAITAAGLVNGVVFIPQGTHLITSAGTECLLVTHPIHIVGTGYGSVLQVKATTGATVDIIHIKPATTNTNDSTMYLLEDFRITSPLGAAGRHAINLDTSLAGSFMRRSRISRIWTDPLNGNAIQTVTGSGNNLFTATVDDCFLNGGVNLTLGGDSVVITNCVITGAGQLFVSNVSGAGQTVIEQCNITCSGGVKIGSATAIRIRNNNMQISAAFTGTNSAFINIDGGVLTGEISSSIITVLAGAGTIDNVRINSADRISVTGNYLLGVAGASLVRTTALSTNAFIAGNSYSGAGTAITDAGVTTTILDQLANVLPGTLQIVGATGTLYMQGTGNSVIVGGTTGLILANNANSVVNLLVTNAGHLVSGGSSVPTFGTLKTGITSQTLTRGTDKAGIITLACTGAAPGSGVTVCDVVFGTAYTNTPVVKVGLATTSSTVIEFTQFAVSTTGFSIAGLSALVNSATYAISYWVMGT